MTNLRKSHKLYFLVLALAGYCLQAVAQTAPTIGDVLRQVRPGPVPLLDARPYTLLDEQAPQGEPLSEGSGGTVRVQAFELEGNSVVDSATLLALLADSVGQQLTVPALEALALRITRYYRAHGYFVARAYVPAQEIHQGRVRIRIVEGRIDSVELDNHSQVRTATLQSLLPTAGTDAVVALEPLERALRLINETPGAQVTQAEVRPGARVGTSTLAIEAQASAAYGGYMLLDNEGSVYTGRERLSVSLVANSPTLAGDKLSLDAMVTEANALQNARAAYGVLLASNGLRGELALGQTRYQLGNSYQNLEATGTAQTLDFAVNYPVLRQRSLSLDASATASIKNLDDRIDATASDTPKRARTLALGLHWRGEDRVLALDGVSELSVTATAGSLEIEDPSAAALDAAGAATQGNFAKVNVALARDTALPLDFGLRTSVRAQQTVNDKNMDSSERLAVSGSAAVAAYPPGELIGSNATLVQLALSRPVPAWGKFSNTWLLFADWGQAAPATALVGEGTREISDLGLGWDSRYRQLFLRARLAHALDSTPALSEPTPVDNFLLQLGAVF